MRPFEDINLKSVSSNPPLVNYATTIIFTHVAIRLRKTRRRALENKRMNDPPGHKQSGKFIDHLSNYQLQKDSAPCCTQWPTQQIT
jgi:hypothetical protein